MTSALESPFEDAEMTPELLRRYAQAEAKSFLAVPLILAAELGAGRTPVVPSGAFLATVATAVRTRP